MTLRKALFAAALVISAAVPAVASSQTELEGKMHIVRCNADGSYDCAAGCTIGQPCC